MTITFNQIPSSIRTPGAYVEIDNSRALRGLPQYPTRILVLGQRLTTGTVAANTPVLVSSAEQAKSYFGRGSLLANMFAALKANNRYIETWGMGIADNGAGVAATGTIVFSGTPTENGTYNLYICGVWIPVAILTTHTASNIATNVGAAINALGDLPVTASVNTATVTVTARNKGPQGNEIDIRANYLGVAGGQKTPAGLTATITAMSSGATAPSLSAPIAAIPDERFDYVVSQFNDATSVAAIEAELSSRWGPLRMLEGHAFIAKVDTQANLTTYGNARNSEHLTCIGIYNTPTPPWEIASAAGAQIGYSASIDPARPFNTLPLVGVLAPPEVDRWTQDEANTLLYDGITTVRVARDGMVSIERAITTYQTNPAGSADSSYLDVNTLLTLAYLRQDLRQYLASLYSRHKIADDNTRYSPGQAITTPKEIKAAIISRFTLWEQAGLVEDRAQFARDLIVERNISDPTRVDILANPNLINGLHVLAAQIQFIL